MRAVWLYLRTCRSPCIFLPVRCSPIHPNNNTRNAMSVPHARRTRAAAPLPPPCAPFTAIRRIMQCLQQQGLVDDYTRALFVTSTMYSVSAARYVQTNVFFEFSSYGGITARLDLMAGSMPDLTCMNEYHDRQMWFLPQGPCGNNQRCLDINNSTFNSRGTMKAGYIGSRLPYIKLADGSTRPRSTEREKFDHESYQLWAEPRYRMGMGLPYISSRMHYCYAFAVMFFMYFLVQEVEELVELGPFEYLGSFWNIYDLATLVCLFVTLLLDSFGKNHTPSPDAELYYEWNTANMWFDRAGSAGALCVLMVWIKVFKYMVWLPNVRVAADVDTTRFEGGSRRICTGHRHCKCVRDCIIGSYGLAPYTNELTLAAPLLPLPSDNSLRFSPRPSRLRRLRSCRCSCSCWCSS